MLKVICFCGKESLIPEQFCGEGLTCPNCHDRYALPKSWRQLGRPLLAGDLTPQTIIQIFCQCSAKLDVPLQLAGKRVRCQTCGREKGVPQVAVPDSNQAVAVATVAAQAGPAASTRVCPRCKAPLDGVEPYCPTCGAHPSTGLTHPDGQPLWLEYQAELRAEAEAEAAPGADRAKSSTPSTRISRMLGSGNRGGTGSGRRPNTATRNRNVGRKKP